MEFDINPMVITVRKFESTILETMQKGDSAMYSKILSVLSDAECLEGISMLLRSGAVAPSNIPLIIGICGKSLGGVSP